MGKAKNFALLEPRTLIIGQEVVREPAAMCKREGASSYHAPWAWSVIIQSSCPLVRLPRYILPAHIHQYAQVDMPCLILCKTGEPKYDAILLNYFLPRPLS